MRNTEKTISSRAVSHQRSDHNYIDLHAYQDALVRKGIEEMRKRRVVSHEEIVKRLKREGRARQ